MRFLEKELARKVDLVFENSLKHLPYFSFYPHFLQVADTQQIIEKNSVTRETRA